MHHHDPQDLLRLWQAHFELTELNEGAARAAGMRGRARHGRMVPTVQQVLSLSESGGTWMEAIQRR